jgi:hypothetical protein
MNLTNIVEGKGEPCVLVECGSDISERPSTLLTLYLVEHRSVRVKFIHSADCAVLKKPLNRLQSGEGPH